MNTLKDKAPWEGALKILIYGESQSDSKLMLRRRSQQKMTEEGKKGHASKPLWS